MRRLAIAVAAAAGLAGGSVALADYLGFKMLNGPQDPFPYYIDGRSAQPVPGVSLSQAQQATDQAWATWHAVPCAAVAFQSLGPSTNNSNIADPRDPTDLYNVSTNWITDAGDPYYGYALAYGSIATALPVAYAGTLYTCDTYVNAVDYTWSTATPMPIGNNVADLQSVLEHESGHCLGLGHSAYPEDVMYAFEPVGQQKRTLSQDDVDAICGLYPATGAVGSPCLPDGGCDDAGLSCVRAPQPDGGVGAPFCSMGCDAGASPDSCPAPYVCKPATLIPNATGACLPSNHDYVTQVGAPCTANVDCGSADGQCLGTWPSGYCTQTCGPQAPPCPAGSTCLSTGANNLCFTNCQPDIGACRSGYACEPTSVVDLSVCVPACATDSDCNPGGGNAYRCRPCDGVCLATTQNPGAQVGDSCTGPNVCGLGQLCLGFGTNPSSGICSQSCGTTCTACPTGTACLPLGANGEPYCLKACSSTAPCPTGLTCQLFGDGYGCAPECGSSVDCPVGDQCVSGTCVNPFANDGGSNGCPGCSPPDAGSGNGGVDAGAPPDAGPVGGGCGCQSAEPSVVVFGVLAVLLFAGAFRRCPPR